MNENETLRQKKLSYEIRHIIAECFSANQLSDPRLQGITISNVKITPDLQLASVYFMLDDPTRTKEAIDGLEHCQGFLRKRIAEGLRNMRRVPSLRFFYDDSIDKYDYINALLRSVQ